MDWEVGLGVEISSHRLGDYVDEVPAGTVGAAIGLRQGDVIIKAGMKGQPQLPVKYHKSVQNILSGLQKENAEVSEKSPLVIAVRRGVSKELKEGEWTCPTCGKHNGPAKLACNRCGALKTDGGGDADRKPLARPRSISASTTDAESTSARPLSSASTSKSTPDMDAPIAL
jgi:hypothetical protein